MKQLVQINSFQRTCCKIWGEIRNLYYKYTIIKQNLSLAIKKCFIQDAECNANIVSNTISIYTYISRLHYLSNLELQYTNVIELEMNQILLECMPSYIPVNALFITEINYTNNSIRAACSQVFTVWGEASQGNHLQKQINDYNLGYKWT